MSKQNENKHDTNNINHNNMGSNRIAFELRIIKDLDVGFLLGFVFGAVVGTIIGAWILSAIIF